MAMALGSKSPALGLGDIEGMRMKGPAEFVPGTFLQILQLKDLLGPGEGQLLKRCGLEAELEQVAHLSQGAKRA